MCEDGRPLQEVWMVLEFCNRGTLSDAIQRGWLLSVRDGAPQPGQLDLLRALATAREVARAMEYLHSQSVLHGDLNGNNILLAGAALAPDGVDRRGFTAKVADFGLSRIITPGGYSCAVLCDVTQFVQMLSLVVSLFVPVCVISWRRCVCAASLCSSMCRVQCRRHGAELLIAVSPASHTAVHVAFHALQRTRRSSRARTAPSRTWHPRSSQKPHTARQQMCTPLASCFLSC